MFFVFRFKCDAIKAGQKKRVHVNLSNGQIKKKLIVIGRFPLTVSEVRRTIHICCETAILKSSCHVLRSAVENRIGCESIMDKSHGFCNNIRISNIQADVVEINPPNSYVINNVVTGGLMIPPNSYVINNVVTGGLMVELIQLLSQVLNFNYTFRIFPLGAFDELWDSIIKNEVDFEGIGFIPDSADYEGLDYLTANIFDVYMAVILRQPPQDDIKLNYTDPFPQGVWLALLLLWLMTCILSTICTTEEKTSVWQKVTSIFMKIVLLKELVPSKAIYNSLLIATIAMHEDNDQYETLEDLLHDNVKFCIENQSNYNPILKASQQQPFIKLNQVLKDSPHITTHDDGYQKAITESFAFIENSVDAMYGIKFLCELELLPTKYFPSGSNMAFPKKSFVKEPFSIVFLLFRTAGILRKETEKYVSLDRPLCNKPQTLQILKLRQVTLPFRLLMIGILVSIVAFSIEMLQEWSLTNCGKHLVKEVDLEGVGFIPGSADYIIFDFLTSNVYGLYMTVVLRQPSLDDHKVINYTDSFPLNVWLALVTLWLTTCILSTICDTTKEKTSVWHKVATVLMKLVLLKELKLSQSSSVSMRIVIATYFFHTVIILAVYNSLLIAKTTVHENTLQYETLEDLLQDNVQFCIENQSNYHLILKTSRQQPFIKLYEVDID
uniref:Ionotropic glutamate receptor C-terminal domain-containing protein n=1 Tax=Strigamia maritima TaxID=126957 RepID=T1IQG5_STRMM